MSFSFWITLPNGYLSKNLFLPMGYSGYESELSNHHVYSATPYSIENDVIHRIQGKQPYCAMKSVTITGKEAQNTA